MSLPQLESELPLRSRRELGQDIVDLIHAGLCAEGPDGMTRYEISRDLFRHQLRADLRDAALRKLEMEGKIQSKMVRGRNRCIYRGSHCGRPSKAWFAVQPSG